MGIIPRFLTLLAIIAIGIRICAAENSVTAAGKPAPLFRSQNLNAASPVQVNLAEQFSDDSQHAVIVSFFATWCAPCRQELLFWQHVADSLTSQGLRLIAVCVDTVYGTPQKKMVHDLKLVCPVIHDKNGKVARLYSYRKVLPYTVFINTRGFVTETLIGYHPKKNAAMVRRIRRMMGNELL